MPRFPFAVAAAVVLGVGVGVTTEVRAAESIATPAVSDTQVDLRFRRMDKDSDASLTRSETLVYPVLTRQFINLDADRNGRLSVSEFSGVRAQPHRLVEIFSF